jgi:serine/threonine-protein kinase
MPDAPPQDASVSEHLPGRAPGVIVAGKYRLVALLGKGGTGAVYEAEHVVIGRRFAIKFLLPGLATDPGVLARFEHEARAAGRLESEHIAAGLDFGIADDGAPFIVMERLLGETLRQILQRGPLPADRAAGLIVQACRGMAVAHGHGLVHRDLKPANLMVGRRADGTDHLRILDFGVAKLRNASHGATHSGALIGTAHYMSPEQVRGSGDVDELTDVYALGCTLFEALSLHKPHPGETYDAILSHILFEPVRPLRELCPGLPAGLAEIVMATLVCERAGRIDSVAELGNALLRFIHPPPAPIEVASHGKPVAEPPAQPAPAPPESETIAADSTFTSMQDAVLPVPEERSRHQRTWPSKRYVLLFTVACGLLLLPLAMGHFRKPADQASTRPPPLTAGLPVKVAATDPPTALPPTPPTGSNEPADPRLQQAARPAAPGTSTASASDDRAHRRPQPAVRPSVRRERRPSQGPSSPTEALPRPAAESGAATTLELDTEDPYVHPK